MEFVETPFFTKDVCRLLTDESYGALQQVLATRPEHGGVMRGSGGLRKLRWAEQGRGKRGGLRIIYYFDKPHDTIYMLWLYRKTEQEDLTPAQVKLLRRVVAEEIG